MRILFLQSTYAVGRVDQQCNVFSDEDGSGYDEAGTEIRRLEQLRIIQLR